MSDKDTIPVQHLKAHARFLEKQIAEGVNALEQANAAVRLHADRLIQLRSALDEVNEGIEHLKLHSP